MTIQQCPKKNRSVTCGTLVAGRIRLVDAVRNCAGDWHAEIFHTLQPLQATLFPYLICLAMWSLFQLLDVLGWDYLGIRIRHHNPSVALSTFGSVHLPDKIITTAESWETHLSVSIRLACPDCNRLLSGKRLQECRQLWNLSSYALDSSSVGIELLGFG